MYKIFVELLQKNGVTPYKVAQATGIGNSTFTDWKNGRSVPKQDKLQKIADYFGVSVDYLMGREQKEKTPSLDKQLSKEEFALYGEVHDLTDEEKQKVLDFIKFTKSQRKDD